MIMAKEREIYMLIHTISEVREKVREWKKEGLTYNGCIAQWAQKFD